MPVSEAFKLVAFSVAALSLASCVPGQQARAPVAAVERAEPGISVINLDAYGPSAPIDVDRIPTWTEADIKEFLAGKTRRSTTPIHGTQVSYATADGRTYLWYPGNNAVLAGRWKTEERSIEVRRGGEVVARKSQPRICYDYGPGTYNPATGHGSGWECTNFVNLQMAGGETQAGDVFGLSRRKAVPFVLSKEPATIENLRTRLKGGAT
jgi:hypothetical protein